MASNDFAYKNFLNNITSVEELSKLHVLIVTDYPLLNIQSDELLRAIIVLAVSALDNYLHDFYRTEIVESFLGTGNFNIKFENIKISVKIIKELESAFSEAEKRGYLNAEIRKMQKTESFQSPKSIENIFTNIDVKNIWSKIESTVGMTAKNIRDELGLIIERRNKISHESDWDFINQKKNSIEKSEVDIVVDFVKKLVNGIETVTP